ncbi:hypothetical protein P872_12230 [Rhodonellum psychrophilum GCM71 = DSM 17998]|uniref:Uncharacterized protein n=2 Tax=Rhodonellum TaxID=336827 RepID=U5BK78_9BACT|nr:hypothetical protein P872_12230 [Rhodonellum psychrophilum GCM71 = DSM 17998]SDZ23803.1 hypothetical protein SAMN05444412_10860 [Rhodonellum ikkaensis]
MIQVCGSKNFDQLKFFNPQIKHFIFQLIFPHLTRVREVGKPLAPNNLVFSDLFYQLQIENFDLNP